MAQEEIIFKVGVDTGDSASRVASIDKEFDILRKSIKDTEQEVDKLSKEFGANSKEADEAKKKLSNLSQSYKELSKAATDVNAKFEEVYGELQPLTTRMGEAEDRLYELALAGKTNTKEYQDLLETVARYRQTQIETDRVVDNAAQTFSQKLGSAIQGAAAGFQLVQGASALFGEENEELEKTLLKVQSAMALADGIEGVRQALPMFVNFGNAIKTKVIGAVTSLTGAELANAQATGTMTALQKVYTFVVGASTGAMKAFRIALAATGIGAVVVLLGLAADAMGLFGSSTDETAEKVKKLKEKQQAYKDQLQAELDLLTKLRAERKDGTTQLENNIRVMKAKGASDKEVYEAERALIKKQLDELAFALGYKGSLNLEERNKKRQLLTDLQVLDAEYNRKVKEDQKKANEDALAKQKERRAILKEEAQERLNLQRKLEDLTVANIDDVNTREIMSLKLKHDREREELIKQYEGKKGLKEKYDALMLELDNQQENERAALKKQQEDAQTEKDKAKQEKDKAKQEKENLDKRSQLEAELIRAEEDFNLKQQKRIELENLDYEQKKSNIELTNGELELLKANHEKNLLDISKDSTDRQKMLDEELANSKKFLLDETANMFGALAGLSEQGSAVQKAFAITQLSIDTAKSLSATIAGATAAAAATGPAAPFVLGGYIAAGVATVTKAMSSAKQILNAPMPSVQAPTLNRPTDNTQNNATQGAQTEIQAQSTYKVVVVDSDITKMQEKTKKTELISTI